jgi:hypothetical protein
LLSQLQWDMLEITRGLAGWRLVAASTPQSPPDGDAPSAAVLAFQLAGGLAKLTLTLRPAGGDEGTELNATAEMLACHASAVSALLGRTAPADWTAVFACVTLNAPRRAPHNCIE